MIGIILDILAVDNYYNISEEIEIAKGKYKTPENLREVFNKSKRRARWLKSK